MWRALVSAVGFLTRFPVPQRALADADVARGAGFFSWVGGLVALLLWGAEVGLRPLGHTVSALCLVSVWAIVTAGLHLDGLADTVDGLSGGRGDRSRTLEIMRDSRIGAHGAVALCLALGLKWAALERLLSNGRAQWIVAPVVARFACTLLLASFAYARPQGLGSAFSGRVGVAQVLLGGVVCLPLYALFETSFVVASVVGVACALGIALRMRSILGGLTGDVHGAAIEVCEIAVLLALGVPALWA